MITDFTAEEQAILDGITGWEEFYSEKPTIERITTGHYWGSFIVDMLLKKHIVSDYTFSDEMRKVYQESFRLFDEIDKRRAAGETISAEEEDLILEPTRVKTRALMDSDPPQDYGVCDTPEQVLERWPELLTDPRRFIIFFTEVRKEDQPANGGWRWHKWGEYIGTKNPQCEYIAHEEDIDSVLCFSIVQMKHVI